MHLTLDFDTQASNIAWCAFENSEKMKKPIAAKQLYPTTSSNL